MRKSITDILIILLTILVYTLITWGVLVASIHLLGFNYHITFKFALGVTLVLLYISFILNVFRGPNGR